MQRGQAAAIGIFARGSDPIAQRLKAHLEARGAQVLVLELGQMAAGRPLAFDTEEWLFDGHALSELDAFFVRQIPAETAMLDEPEATNTAASWWQRSIKAKERAHLAQSCLYQLEAMGKRVVNPSASLAFDLKPLQLAAFQAAGIRVPRTLITNLADGVLSFEKDVGPLVYKPVAGGAETGLFDETARGRLDQLAGAPVIFQERLVGPDIRVTVVADRVVSSVEIPTTELDYRQGKDYRTGAQHYIEHPLPQEIEAMCLKAARVCHHQLSGIDLKKTADGYVLLEANSGPVYLDIELKTGAGITDALAELLMRP